MEKTQLQRVQQEAICGDYYPGGCAEDYGAAVFFRETGDHRGQQQADGDCERTKHRADAEQYFPAPADLLHEPYRAKHRV